MKRKLYFLFFHLCALFLLYFSASNIAYAQSYQTFSSELEQIIKDTKWRIGPFRIYPTIQLKNVGYDDNVYYQREEDTPVSDYTATVSPEIKVNLLFRNYLILSLSENPEYVFYFKQQRERRFNNILSPAFKFLFLHRFVISGKYSNNNRRRRATSEFDVRANELIEEYSGSIFYETARGTSFGIVASQRDISYEDIDFPGQEIRLSRALNRLENRTGINIYYRIFSQSFLFLKGNYSEYMFEYEDFGLRDSFSYGVNVGIQFPMQGNTTGQLSLGYKELIPRSSDKKGFKGLVGDTEIKFKLLRFRFSLGYSRDCRFSFWGDNLIFIEDRLDAGIFFYLTKFLRVDYSYSYGEGNYPELILLRMPDGNYEKVKLESIYRIQLVGFIIKIIRNIGIGVRVNYWERESNYYLAGRNRMFISAYVTHNF